MGNKLEQIKDYNRIHRSIRRQSLTRHEIIKKCIVGLICCIVFAVKLNFICRISYTALSVVRYILSPIGNLCIKSCGLFEKSDLFYIPVNIQTPTPKTSIIILVICSVIMLLLPRVKKIPLPLTVLCEVLISPLLVYSFFFNFIPSWFVPADDSISIVFSQSAMLIYLGFPILFLLFLSLFPCGFWRSLFYVVVYELILAATYILKYIFVIPLLLIGTQYAVPYAILFVLTLYDILILNSYFSNISCTESKRINNTTKLWEKS